MSRNRHKFAVTLVGEIEDNIGVRTVKGVEVCLGDIDSNCDKYILRAGVEGINSDKSVTGISTSS